MTDPTQGKEYLNFIQQIRGLGIKGASAINCWWDQHNPNNVQYDAGINGLSSSEVCQI